ELRCWFLRARFNTGDESALAETGELWNVGHSQAKACDPLFKVWMERGMLTPELAWERHGKAIAAGELSLAKYVAGKMPPELRPLAELYREVHRRPEALANHERFSSQDPRMHEIILHGIRRYALRKPLEALEHWRRYDAQHYFPAEDRERTLDLLTTHLAVEGHMKAAQQLLDQADKVTNSQLIAWLVRDALRAQDWQRAYKAINRFSPEEQQEERWLYWRARAMAELGISDPQFAGPEQILSR